VTTPLNFTKFNFGIRLHFTYFQSFLVGEERGGRQILAKREKVSIGEEFDHQNDYFLC
jgi:hypothetical protein